jgi:ribosomal protein S18 acetylase RimI-like enzyme
MPSLSRGLQLAKGRLFPFGLLRIKRAVKRGEGLDLLLIGVKPELQKSGVNSVVMNEMHKAAIEHGRLEVETNGELETNEAVQALWQGYDARQHKRRRIYRKRIG